MAAKTKTQAPPPPVSVSVCLFEETCVLLWLLRVGSDTLRKETVGCRFEERHVRLFGRGTLKSHARV
eukprot:3133628-Rhodomonas_salina.1